MSYLEATQAELEAYLPALTRRPDFSEFWSRTIAQANSVSLDAKVTELSYPSPFCKVYELSYCGFDSTRIHGWYLFPTFATKNKKLPVMIQYHGFTGSRGLPHDYANWLLMGMAVVAIDCRQQGGITGNMASYSGGMFLNVTSLGLLSKEEYYYRAVYMDAMKAINFVESRPELDSDKIVLHGISQGGALTMAIAALSSRVCLAMPDVPSNSNLEERVIGEHGAFSAVSDYLKANPQDIEQVFETLSYFDTMNMAEFITCPIFASVGLKDSTCPARCYFASYNRVISPKQIIVYPLNRHDGCNHLHTQKQMEYLSTQPGLLNDINS